MKIRKGRGKQLAIIKFCLQSRWGGHRVFLPLVLKGCVDWAKENNVTIIDANHMQIINDKRAKEKIRNKAARTPASRRS